MDLINHDPLDEEILILRELTKELWSYLSIEDKKKWWSIDDYFRWYSWSEKHNYYKRIVELPTNRNDNFYYYSDSYVHHGYYSNQYMGVGKIEIEKFIDETYPIICSNFIYKMEEYIKENLCSVEYEPYCVESEYKNKWYYCYYREDGNHLIINEDDDKYHKSYSDKNREIALLKMSIDVLKNKEKRNE